MDQAKLIVDTSSLQLLDSGSVHGQVVVCMDNYRFPEPGWTDFAEAIAAALCDVAARLLNGERGPVEVRFMEGPFSVEMQPSKPRVWSVVLVEHRRKRVVRRSGEVSIEPLVRSILTASNELIAVCQARRWSTHDTPVLQSSRDELQESFASYGRGLLH